jgi:hypothetical protein
MLDVHRKDRYNIKYILLSYHVQRMLKVVCSAIYFVISCGIIGSEIFQFSKRLYIIVLPTKYLE